MRVLRFMFALIALLVAPSFSALAQNAPRLERVLGISGRQKLAGPLPSPQGLQDHVANGKLVLSLDDSIHLALSNNTDVRLDHSQIEFAQNNLHRAHGPFDPLVTSSFADNRTKSPTITQTQGAPILETLSQTTASVLSIPRLRPIFNSASPSLSFATSAFFPIVLPSLSRSEI